MKSFFPNKQKKERKRKREKKMKGIFHLPYKRCGVTFGVVKVIQKLRDGFLQDFKKYK